MLIDENPCTVALYGALFNTTSYKEYSFFLTSVNPACTIFFISFVTTSVAFFTTLISQFNCTSITIALLLLAPCSMHHFILNSLNMCSASRSVGVSINESSSYCWSSLFLVSSGASAGVFVETYAILTGSLHFVVLLLITSSSYTLVTLYVISVHFLAGSCNA